MEEGHLHRELSSIQAWHMESKTGPLENDVMLIVVNLHESLEGSTKGTLLLYGHCDSSGHYLINEDIPGTWN